MTMRYLAAALLAFAAGAAHAQEQAGDWSVTVAPYIWGTALDGDARVRGIDAEVDVGFDDILEDLSFALMAFVDVRKGDYGVFVNPLFSRTESEVSAGPIDIDVTNDLGLLAVGGFYRVGEWRLGTTAAGTPRTLAVEPLAGVRLSYLALELDVEGGREVDGDEVWLDPIVGARAFVDLSERWRLALEGDVGGFGVGSDFSWNAQGYVTYRTTLFGRPTSFGVGYRALSQDYDDDGFAYDVVQHGPIVGAAFRF